MTSRTFAEAPRLLLAPMPLPLLQPILHHLAARMVRDRPELFERLGPHKHKLFLLNPTNLPFAVLLRPDPGNVLLKAVRRRALPPHDARIEGSFLNLLDLVDGRLDGDALFFSRDLRVSGDTEAIVSLRNALDDVEVGVADHAAAIYGPAGRALLDVIRTIRSRHRENPA